MDHIFPRIGTACCIPLSIAIRLSWLRYIKTLDLCTTHILPFFILSLSLFYLLQSLHWTHSTLSLFFNKPFLPFILDDHCPIRVYLYLNTHSYFIPPFYFHLAISQPLRYDRRTNKRHRYHQRLCWCFSCMYILIDILARILKQVAYRPIVPRMA